MKKRINTLWIMLMITLAISGQSAKEILDKTAQVISNPNGINATFSISSKQFGNTTGSISIKGKKFKTITAYMTVWFDGKTQWTYIKNNDEVNISNPSEKELQTINPYSYIYLYKKNYTANMQNNGNNYIVHLNGGQKQTIEEVIITINKQTYIPSQIKIRQGKQWSSISISDFKRVRHSDLLFKFNSKEYPRAEVIDLR